jgi:hypothetical protein
VIPLQRGELEGDEATKANLKPLLAEGCSLYRTVILPGLASSMPVAPKRPGSSTAEAHPIFYLSGGQSISRTLTQYANPTMTLFAKAVIEGLDLPTFRSTQFDPFPFSDHTVTREEVESGLAPHALIALMAERLLRELIHQGSSYALKERAAALQQPLGTKQGILTAEQSRSVLTPHHILTANQLSGPISAVRSLTNTAMPSHETAEVSQ